VVRRFTAVPSTVPHCVKKLIGYCNRQPPKYSEVPASCRLIGVLRLSGEADDQALSRCFDDLLSDSFQGIDIHQAGNLHEKAVEQSELSPSDSDNCRHGLFLGKSFLHSRQSLGAVTKTLPLWRIVSETANTLNTAHVHAYTGLGPSFTQ
jgi:hypothetical protein